jgi:hypothetical protein
MSDAPERIWMFAKSLKQYMPGGGKISMGDVEYIRADRIETLTAERDMAAEGWAEATRLIDVARQQYGAEKSRAEKAEAKLAKAVRTMREAVTAWERPHYGGMYTAIDLIRTTLAELEGSNAP